MARFGWTFHYRVNPELGGYLFATHHAVWHAPDGFLVDVTPLHPDPKHHPIGEDGSVLFLVDDSAEPIRTDHVIGPRPIRYFPLGNDERLVEYVNSLSLREQVRCEEIRKRFASGEC